MLINQQNMIKGLVLKMNDMQKHMNVTLELMQKEKEQMFDSTIYINIIEMAFAGNIIVMKEA